MNLHSIYKRTFIFFLCITILIFHACSSKRDDSINLTYKKFVGPQNMVASWYGPDFHGKPTSSGEIYNMYSHTAAHKKLPFGTKLRVTNAKTEQSTFVIINDRGPFIPGRDIDLSYQAAKDIGLIAPGTGTVKVSFIGRDEKYIKYLKPISLDKGPFTIQIGSFSDQSNAIRLKKALQLSYNKIHINRVIVNRQAMYRVRIGKYYNRESADNLADTLANEGYNVIVTQYDK